MWLKGGEAKMDHSFNKIAQLLADKQNEITTKWFHLMLEEYPAETARNLKDEKNQFANPVGSTLKEGITGILQGLIEGLNVEKMATAVDKVIRIKAVQETSPSQSVAFIYKLKDLIREEVKGQLADGRISHQELFLFESQIDRLALLSFNIYMECREKVYQLRINEVNRNYKMLERAVYGKSAVDQTKA